MSEDPAAEVTLSYIADGPRVAFTGNSDEALSTHSGKPGAEDYSLRENMEKAVRILRKRAEEKHAKMVLWAPHAYQYGFFRDKTAKPWKAGNVGDWYERDGDIS